MPNIKEASFYGSENWAGEHRIIHINEEAFLMHCLGLRSSPISAPSLTFLAKNIPRSPNGRASEGEGPVSQPGINGHPFRTAD